MPLPPIASDVCSVVITGQLRPVTISPDWVREHDLLSQGDIENSKIDLLIPNEAIDFTSGWLHCQANPQSWQFDTQDQTAFESLRDFSVGVLKTMTDTPIAQMGINRAVHFTTPDFDSWDSVGNRLVNNEIWHDLLHLPGMRSVTYWGRRQDDYSGRIQVQVEPSVAHKSSVFVAYNDHYDLTYAESIPQIRQEASSLVESFEATPSKIKVSIEILQQRWEESMRLSNQILERVADLQGPSDD